MTLYKILRHLSIHFWDSHTAISHGGNPFSTLGTLTVKSGAHKMLLCSKSCRDASMAPSLQDWDMSPTRNQNALGFPKCFISLLCLELGCTSQKNLVSSVLKDKPWHSECFPSCRIIVTIYHPVHVWGYESLLLSPPLTLTERTPHFRAIVPSQLLLLF